MAFLEKIAGLSYYTSPCEHLTVKIEGIQFTKEMELHSIKSDRRDLFNARTKNKKILGKNKSWKELHKKINSFDFSKEYGVCSLKSGPATISQIVYGYNKVDKKSNKLIEKIEVGIIIYIFIYILCIYTPKSNKKKSPNLISIIVPTFLQVNQPPFEYTTNCVWLELPKIIECNYYISKFDSFLESANHEVSCKISSKNLIVQDDSYDR